MESQTLNGKNRRLATLSAFAIIPISGLATDIYLPSMPAMASSFQLPESRIQLTLALFLISYGLSQTVAGAVVDAFGRYKISLLALGLFVVSFLVTAHTTHIEVVYAMRIVQGILSGFVVVSKRAFFVDVYDGEERRQYLSIMTIVWSLAPIIAPFLGGYLQQSFGWRSNFQALAAYCALMFLLELFFSGETIKIKNPFRLDFLWKETRVMLQALDFRYGIVMCGLSYGLVIFYNSSGPFIIEHHLGYPAVTSGYVSLFMGLAWMCGGFLSKAMLPKPMLPKLSVAIVLQIGVALLMLATSSLVANLWTLACFAFFVHMAASFVFNNYFAYCIGRFPRAAGVSGGLTGGGTYILTSVVSYALVALLHPQTQSEIAVGYFVGSLASLGVLALVKLQNAYA